MKAAVNDCVNAYESNGKHVELCIHVLLLYVCGVYSQEMLMCNY